ncbi:MAG: nitrous oxide-stimulated promoter family protein [Candidatus Neomarinimicrobiota bacterium]|nr:MAG: nitrous oxide-stimulated promoter family protein [Candidatus Neomarinimicrobiota bacterium]
MSLLYDIRGKILKFIYRLFVHFEPNTIDRMIRIYCRDNHKTRNGLCPECKELKNYAFARLNACPLLPRKPVCSRCPVHCYKPDMREKIRAVMRYSGLRMIYKAPFLTLMHGIHMQLKSSQ